MNEFDGNTAVCLAAYKNHIEMAKLLIEAGADMDKADKDAAWLNRTEPLLEAGADMNKADDKG